MSVLPVSNRVFDVFWGKGWDNWARFEKKYFNGKLHLQLLKGIPMRQHDFKTLIDSMT